jgi:thiol-disulfide isomerase/thioredoxin
VRTKARPGALLLAVLLVISAGAVPAAAAKQEFSSRVKVRGAELPAPDDHTYATADDPVIGKTPPTLIAKGFNGKKVEVTDNGIPRIVIFLSHSCPHCQAEVPEIVKLAKRGTFDGIQVDTITTNTSEDLPNYPPSKWLKREHWPFKPVLLDDPELRALVAFGGNSFPYFVFVNADGTVAGRTSGELPPDLIADIAARLVAGQSIFGE